MGKWVNSIYIKQFLIPSHLFTDQWKHCPNNKLGTGFLLVSLKVERKIVSEICPLYYIAANKRNGFIIFSSHNIMIIHKKYWKLSGFECTGYLFSEDIQGITHSIRECCLLYFWLSLLHSLFFRRYL